MASYKSLNHIIRSLAGLLKPPDRLSVSKAAEKYRFVNQPGSYVGQWDNSTTPYMAEPQDVLGSSEFQGCVFVGPAQCGKTDALLINKVVHTQLVDPMDMMIVCPTNGAARDFSMRRIDRLHRHSSAVGEMMLKTSDADNVFDKHYKNGSILSLSWPSPTEVAGKPIPIVLITDRDRMPDDVGGDGEVFDLAAKRTTTFGSNAMTLAESSPSRPVTENEDGTRWIAKTPHEAPPAAGIMSLYNRGDRRRWYWPCPFCDEYFEGLFEHLKWVDREGMSNKDKSDTAYMVCPCCKEKIAPEWREEMQSWGMWLKDGQTADKNGRVSGTGPSSWIASFWLRGVAAAFVTWRKLVNLYLDAMEDFERTGSEEALKKFYNNDCGEPYVPQGDAARRVPETIMQRSEPLRERHVPADVRFLIATVDVQKNMFAVQVFGIVPGKPFDMVLIDRFDIRKSQREDDDGERLWVKPAVYPEDWDEITEHVINKTYPLDDDSGRRMAIHLTGCDSGGKAGVTSRAYEYYRRLRADNLQRKFILVKGDPLPAHPRARISYPDSNRKDRKSGARGDIPVVMFNSNLLKDDLNGRLDCEIPGSGMFRTPNWLPLHVFQELCAEIRTEKGWVKEAKNEAWDLSYYCIGLCVSELIRVDRIDWANPPHWAAEWDRNSAVIRAEDIEVFAIKPETHYDFAKYASQLA